MFRFMRVICHGARLAIAAQSLLLKGNAVNIWNGTSGTASDSPFLKASKLRTTFGSASNA